MNDGPISSSNPITALAFAPADDRYLISGAADASVALYDIEQRIPPPQSNGSSSSSGGGAINPPFNSSASSPAVEPLVILEKRSGGSRRGADHHTACISAVQWWPRDTGMFLTSSMDGSVKIWDTNRASVATSFPFQNMRVYAAAISPTASCHALIATGTSSRNVSLCDMRSGGAAHLLLGHSESVWSVAWSPADEFLLATGSCDQTVKLWDIRRPGSRACLATLNMDRTRSTDPIAPPRSRPRSHDGAISALRWTPEGRFLLSSGTDSRLRLWHRDGHRIQAHYQGTANQQKKGSGFALACPGGGGGRACGGGGGNSGNGVNGYIGGMKDSVVFHPNGCEVRGFNILEPEGQFIRKAGGSWVGGGGGDLWDEKRAQHSTANGPVTLRGHFATVNALAWRESCQQLYSGGDDGLLLAWSSLTSLRGRGIDSAPDSAGIAAGEDAWTSSDDGREDAK